MRRLWLVLLLAASGCFLATEPDICSLSASGVVLDAAGDTLATYTLREGPFIPCPNPVPAGWTRE